MSEEFNSVTCNSCGLEFKFPKKVEELWRNSEKTFYCPNGHGLVWNKPKESPEQKELVKLRAEVKSLKDKLDEAITKAAEYRVKVQELTSELEIWRPSTPLEEKVEQTNGS